MVLPRGAPLRSLAWANGAGKSTLSRALVGCDTLPASLESVNADLYEPTTCNWCRRIT